MSTEELNNKTIKAEFFDLITTHCNFVKNIDDPNIPPEAIFCFSKHELCRQRRKRSCKNSKRNMETNASNKHRKITKKQNCKIFCRLLHGLLQMH